MAVQINRERPGTAARLSKQTGPSIETSPVREPPMLQERPLGRPNKQGKRKFCIFEDFFIDTWDKRRYIQRKIKENQTKQEERPQWPSQLILR